jgi:hypothetical protein
LFPGPSWSDKFIQGASQSNGIESLPSFSFAKAQLHQFVACRKTTFLLRLNVCAFHSDQYQEDLCKDLLKLFQHNLLQHSLLPKPRFFTLL